MAFVERKRSRKCRRNLERHHGERLAKSLAKAPRRAGMVLLQLAASSSSSLRTKGVVVVVDRAHLLRHGLARVFGSFDSTFRILCSWQRWITGWSKTAFTALARALAPSMTTRIGLVTSSPRSRSPTRRSLTTVAFSVSPSVIESGSFGPSSRSPSPRHRRDHRSARRRP